MQVMVAIDPADFRCRIPGLEAICRETFHEDPTSGAVVPGILQQSLGFYRVSRT
jgi:hypothetical protein